jgi:hypothetical protein
MNTPRNILRALAKWPISVIQRKLGSPSFRATEPDPSFRWDDGMTDRTEAELADRFRRHLA